MTPAVLHAHWLVRLRWAAIAAQIVSIVGTRYLLHAPFSLAPLALIVGLLCVANVALMVTLRRGRTLSDPVVAAHLLLDCAALAGLLVWTGGAMNPFTTLFLLQVVLATILVPRRWSLVVAVCAVVAFGALLLARPEAIHVWHSGEMFVLHVRGMWLAFAMTAAALWVFVDRVTTSLRAREAELATARLAAERAARWSALGTLAAGTAHELNTPLGTVAILAAELAEERALPEEARVQVERIRGEIRRCKDILAQMRAHAPTGVEVEVLVLADWVRREVAAWGERHPGVAVVVGVSGEAEGVRAPVRAVELSQGVGNLLENARRAQADAGVGAAIEVGVRREGEEHLAIAVVDHGVGIPAEHWARLGEPFFTTREPGQGMGLGLFLVEAAAARHGGAMRIQSVAGRTEAVVTVHV